MDARFKAIDKRFDALDKKLDARLASINLLLKRHDAFVQGLECLGVHRDDWASPRRVVRSEASVVTSCAEFEVIV